MAAKVTYKKSGVNIDEANRFVEDIKTIAKGAQRPEVMGGIGGFGAMFRFPKDKFKNPVIVSSTDGVGTKLKLAAQFGKFEMLGIDLVAMNVNDILTCGAEPMFFLDYFAVGKIDLKFMKEVIKGIVTGCNESGCALVGGETAEMPGLYKGEDFDLAGFAVGAVDEENIIDGSKVVPGDVIVGMASNGIHANGFSFVRRVFPKKFVADHVDEILRPTRLYVKTVLDLKTKVQIKAMAHITGGGFYDNIVRVIPKDAQAQIHAGSWKIPQVFQWLAEKGKTPYKEMYRTFNMGVGFVMVMSEADAVKALGVIQKHNIEAWVVGKIARGEGVSIQ